MRTKFMPSVYALGFFYFYFLKKIKLLQSSTTLLFSFGKKNFYLNGLHPLLPFLCSEELNVKQKILRSAQGYLSSFPLISMQLFWDMQAFKMSLFGPSLTCLGIQNFPPIKLSFIGIHNSGSQPEFLGFLPKPWSRLHLEIW